MINRAPAILNEVVVSNLLKTETVTLVYMAVFYNKKSNCGWKLCECLTVLKVI